MNIRNILLIIAIFLSPTTFIFAEKIEDYNVDIRINSDASIDIKESILYDFESAQRHGIERKLIVESDEDRPAPKYKNIEVKDENGKIYQMSTYNDSNYYVLRIGDPDTLITGQKKYVISYKVEKAMNYFDTHDELYWNAIGTDWDAPIKKATVSVTAENIKNSSCYYGPYGSNSSCTLAQKDNTLSTEVNNLSSKEGVTIAVGLTKGTVYQPTKEDEMKESILENIYFPIPIIIFFIYLFRWYKYGRDPEGRKVIVANYTPLKGISPLESKTIMTESVDMSKIGAEMIQLAIKGFIKIDKIKEKGFLSSEDYNIKKLKERDESLTPFQSEFMKVLFGDKNEISISEIKKMAQSGTGASYISSLNSFTSGSGSDKIYTKLTQEGYFPENPSDVRINNILVGILMIIPMIVVPMIIGSGVSALTGFILFIGVMILAGSMPKMTNKGVEAKEYLEGLKKYISVAEIERIKFHNAPEKTPEHFEELLPYAMIFGLENEWAKKFESLNYQPEWYTGPSGTALNSVAIASSLSNINSSFTMSTASSGSSGLGGSGGSGGGGGGGGGGSW